MQTPLKTRVNSKYQSKGSTYFFHLLAFVEIILFNVFLWERKAGFGKLMKNMRDAGFWRKGAGMRDQDPPFQTLIFVIEFFIFAVVVKSWTPFVHHQRLLVSCDNEATVTVINSGSSKDPFMQRCLGQLWFISTLHDFEMHAPHIPGVSAFISSRVSPFLFFSFYNHQRDRFSSGTLFCPQFSTQRC